MVVRIFLLIGWLLLQTGLTQDSVRTWILTPQQLQEDWDSLKKILLQTHTNVHAFFPQEAWQEKVAYIESQLNQEMKASDFYHLVNPIFLGLKDVHSRIWIPRSQSEYVLTGGYHLPVQIRYLDDRVYIMANKDTLLPKGTELLAINHIPINNIIDSMICHQYTDGNVSNTRIRLLEENFFSQFPLFFPLDSLVEVSVRLPNSRRDSLMQFPAVRRIRTSRSPESEQKKKRKKPKREKVDRDEFFKLEIKPEDKTAIITVHTFSGGSELAFRAFLRYAFREINKQQVQALILDVRGNKGGYINRGPTLLKYVADEPFYYVNQSIVRSSPLLKQSIKQRLKLPRWVITFFHPFVGKELVKGWKNPAGVMDTIQWKMSKPKKSKKHFSGDVYLLTDGLSISNSSLVNSAFAYARMGTVVGMPCGGTANGTFGNAVTFQLPHSKLAGRISTIRINSPSKHEGFYPEALQPDHTVPEKIADILAGRDTQLEYTLELIRGEEKKTSSAPASISNP